MKDIKRTIFSKVSTKIIRTYFIQILVRLGLFITIQKNGDDKLFILIGILYSKIIPIRKYLGTYILYTLHQLVKCFFIYIY